MKKALTIISIITVSASCAFAQALPNSGFETWTAGTGYDTPNDWNNLNSTTASFGAITCVKATAPGDFNTGAAALKLITKDVLGNIANGIATTGTINVAAKTVSGGIAYAERPTVITGFYKYTPVSTDNGFVQMILTGAGGDTDTVGIATFKTPNTAVGSYTSFSAPFVYKSTNAVAKALCIISSSASATVHFNGSTLFVDDLNLVILPAGVKELNSLNVTVGPNPTTNFLMINNPETAKATFVIYDVTGRKMAEQLIVNKTTTFDLSEYKNGLYIYSISNQSGNAIQTGKVIVQK